MPSTTNPNVTIPGSGVLLHVLNTSGEPIPVQGDNDGAINTSGGGGGGGTVAQGAAAAVGGAWSVRVANAGASAFITPFAAGDAVAQSGTWNITNISGTISLPTGAATSTLQGAGLPGAFTGGGGVKVGLVDALPAGANSIGTVVSTNAAASQIDGHSASIGATTDTDSALTLIGRIKNLLSRIPAALVGGRFDGNVGAWLGSTVPTIGQKTMANSIPVTVASDQSKFIIEGLNAVGGTSTVKPVAVGGVVATTTTSTTFWTDGNGRMMAVGAAANGSAVTSNPVLCGGSDGTNARTFATSVAGSQVVTFDPVHTGAFGDIVAEQKTPLFGKNFGSNVFVSQLDSTTVVTSGVTDINGNRLRLQTGTTSGASALYNSVKIATYREGQGMQLRFTAAFTTGVANSTQIVGMFTPDFADGYGFGYNGTSFAIFHRNGGADSTVANTYPLAQASWNGNVPSGFDPTKGNVYRIDYPYLGYGDVRFYIQDATTGSFFLVHTIRYANATTTIQLAEPALQFCARALSVSSTTNLTMLVGSYAAFCVGERLFNGPQWSRGNVVNGVTTLAQIIAIRNCTTFNGKTNKRIARVRLFSTSADNGNTTTQFRWFISPTVGGTPAFTPFNGTTGDNGVTLTNAQSILSYDTAGTTITGGDEIFGTLLSRNNSSGPIDATLLNLIVLPGQTLVIGASAGATTNVGVSLNGNED